MGEVESSTGQGTADVEDVYPEELSEAATLPDMRAQLDVEEGDRASIDHGGLPACNPTGECIEADGAMAFVPVGKQRRSSMYEERTCVSNRP